ncbi:MAG: hypothetical protein AAB316_02840 [Bacteroidota bacterium]
MFAQPKDNSPYSRLGLGEPVNHTLSSAGFGGLSAAYADPLHVNLLNPASLGWLGATTFEAGVFFENSTIQFDDETTKVRTGNLNHLSLAFPMRNSLNDVLLKRKPKFFWSMNLALLPNTTVGYNIETEDVLPGVDTVLNSFQGTGGTNKLLIGNGFRYKNFTWGLNLGYLFGQLENHREVEFTDLTASYTDIFLDNISVRGFLWNLGVQYRHDFDKKKSEDEFYSGRSLVIGAYGNSATNFKTKNDVVRIRQNEDYAPVHRDTLFIEEDQKRSGKLPAEFTFGLMYQHTAKLRIGAEFGFANWSNYENEVKPEALFNSRRLAAGIEYIPDYSSYNNYLRRIRYRAGFYHRTDPRLEDLTQYAVTLGFGLPVILPRQQTSFVNLAFELGQYDTPNAIKETFIKIALGFSLNDTSWFFKRKFG